MVAWKHEWKKLTLIAGAFLACFYLPVGRARFDTAVLESLHLVRWYAREHVLLCLIPAFFIAGARTGRKFNFPLDQMTIRWAKCLS